MKTMRKRMTNELTITNNHNNSNNNLLPSQNEFNMFQTIAKNAQVSGLYGGVGGEAKIFMILLAARELGISPMIALNGGIWNIQGKIEISARLMNAMIRRAGHTMQIDSNAERCIIKGKRCDTGEEHTETFTWSMAEKAGLAGGNVWKKYPEDMLYNRCMSRFARRFCPDVIGTAYVEGEIREAIEPEKLPQAECKEILHPKPEKVEFVADFCKDIEQSQEEPKKEATFTLEQQQEFESLISQCSDEYLANLAKNMKSYWNATEVEQIPQKYFISLCNNAKLHIAERAKK